MGIFNSLTTAVGGLQAQAFALQNISGNIANSQTTGYKETDTRFDALVSAAAQGEQTSGSVIAGSVPTNTVQGSIQSSTVATNTLLVTTVAGAALTTRPSAATDPAAPSASLPTAKTSLKTSQSSYTLYALAVLETSRKTSRP